MRTAQLLDAAVALHADFFPQLSQNGLFGSLAALFASARHPPPVGVAEFHQNEPSLPCMCKGMDTARRAEEPPDEATPPLEQDQDGPQYRSRPPFYHRPVHRRDFSAKARGEKLLIIDPVFCSALLISELQMCRGATLWTQASAPARPRDGLSDQRLPATAPLGPSIFP